MPAAKGARHLWQLFHPAHASPTIPCNVSHRYTHTRSQSASEKLFADAAREEAEAESQGSTKSQNLRTLEQEYENWTGDESIKDAVLRMLVDKYKPLRGPSVIMAEQKLKQAPPKVLPTPSGPINTSSVYPKPASGSWANVPLLPSSDTHKPWETTFKAPTHADTSRIRAARLPPPTSVNASRASASGSMDERLLKKEKERMKRVQHVGRLGQALESTLDYRLGIKHGQSSIGRSNPVSVKGWNSLIEEKIERARSAGLFKDVKGRGKPLARSSDEMNPFIAREEFLMNRIVQRNGAAPPWVEVQGVLAELDAAVVTFRELLRQSWTRRAVRIITTDNPAQLLQKISIGDVKALRDPDWIGKEQSYHETAVAELNSLVRKYNGLAPYVVRRPYYSREVEINRMYDASAEDIMRELEERIRDPGFVPNIRSSEGRDAGSVDRAKAMPTAQGRLPAAWRDRIWEWFINLSSRSKQ